MGFAHSVIEDTALVIALGADAVGVLVGRVLFAIVVTALVAAALRHISDKVFHKHIFMQPSTKQIAT